MTETSEVRKLMFMSEFSCLPLFVFVLVTEINLCFQQTPFKTFWQPTAEAKLHIQSKKKNLKSNVTWEKAKKWCLEEKKWRKKINKNLQLTPYLNRRDVWYRAELSHLLKVNIFLTDKLNNTCWIQTHDFSNIYWLLFSHTVTANPKPPPSKNTQKNVSFLPMSHLQHCCRSVDADNPEQNSVLHQNHDVKIEKEKKV